MSSRSWTSTRSSTIPRLGSSSAAARVASARRPPRRAALRAADRGRRVAVLTIDPARRLAQALGLAELGNEPGRVAGSRKAGSPTSPWRAARDDARHAAHLRRDGAGPLDPGPAEKILANPFYQTISTSFSGTQEYMAMEKLGQLAAHRQVGPDRRGHPAVALRARLPRRPAAHVDLPRRPDDPPALLTGPGGRAQPAQVLGAGFSLFTKAVSTILGGQLLADASAFVQAFDTMFGGFRERATATYALLRSPGTAFVVIAAPEPDALREAAYFVDRLRTEDMPLAGLVLNRTHPVLARCPRPRPATPRTSCRAPRSRRPCCACTPTGWTARPGRTGCSPASPAPTPMWR